MDNDDVEGLANEGNAQGYSLHIGTDKATEKLMLCRTLRHTFSPNAAVGKFTISHWMPVSSG